MQGNSVIPTDREFDKAMSGNNEPERPTLDEIFEKLADTQLRISAAELTLIQTIAEALDNLQRYTAAHFAAVRELREMAERGEL